MDSNYSITNDLTVISVANEECGICCPGLVIFTDHMPAELTIQKEIKITCSTHK